MDPIQKNSAGQRSPAAPSWNPEQIKSLKPVLQDLYASFNRCDEVHPDPLEFVHCYDTAQDQEIVGLIAATLAYGRVASILQTVTRVLDVLGPSPHHALLNADRKGLSGSLTGFKHRWTTADELIELLMGMRSAITRHGSLEACFICHHDPGAETTLPGLTGFVEELLGPHSSSSLLSAPEKGSACKRLHLFLRWMVRSDNVDPGCWQSVSPSQLIIPMDTHMHRVARALQMTNRKQANGAAAMDMTRVFRLLAPSDPTRYDFALTRLGIRSDMDLDTFLDACRTQRMHASGGN